MASQAQLRSVGAALQQRTPYGRRCVPVFGSGVNIQAARVEGAKDTDDWTGLLWKIAREVGLSPAEFRRLPDSSLAKWEALLRGWAIHKKVDPFKAEGELQQCVCRELRRQEQASKHYGLYGEILGAGFGEIVSLNFDRRLALHSGREQFAAPRKLPLARSAGETLYRRSVIDRGDGQRPTQIWYPHGDTKKFSTLKLGVRKYGYYIGLLEERRSRMMRVWRESADMRRPRKESKSPYSLTDMLEFSRQSGGVTEWFDLLMAAPLVFIGCSLAPDEWPLWWLLHQRARNAVHFPRDKCPETYILVVCDGKTVPRPHHLRGSPCGLEVVEFPSFDALWAFLRKTFRQ